VNTLNELYLLTRLHEFLYCVALLRSDPILRLKSARADDETVPNDAAEIMLTSHPEESNPPNDKLTAVDQPRAMLHDLPPFEAAMTKTPKVMLRVDGIDLID
jgi:hypothetical protein